MILPAMGWVSENSISFVIFSPFLNLIVFQHPFCSSIPFPCGQCPDPDMLGPDALIGIPFEPVSIGVTRKYLSAIQAWHIIQGWLPPLTEDDHEHINWPLHGLENIQGNCKCPIRPPITISILWSLCASLALNDPFEACIWAMSTCAFIRKTKKCLKCLKVH
jgi:hypothetical protein